jgi:hypothetical protein
MTHGAAPSWIWFKKARHTSTSSCSSRAHDIIGSVSLDVGGMVATDAEFSNVCKSASLFDTWGTGGRIEDELAEMTG